MPTVRKGLLTIAQEMGVAAEDFPEFERVWLGNRISPELPDRYRRLVEHVLWRLPWDWDAHCTWYVTVSGEQSPQCYGDALREEEAEGDHSQLWVVTLYPALLDRLSDAACQAVIAHELAHVASGIPTGSIVINGKPYTRIKGTVDQYQEASSKAMREDVADLITLEWGFSTEIQAFLAEDQ